MAFSARSALRLDLVGWLAACALAGCSSEAPPPPITDTPQEDDPIPVPACDPTVAVTGDSPALMITDPAALASLPLEDVLSQLLQRSGDLHTTPRELLQRMFDTNNQQGKGVYADGVFCDSADNLAHVNGPAASCPRAEGGLAASDGFFTPGHPDHFSPVAAVNRLDLMTTTALTCGEYRIIYAKDSGVSDPEDRVFLIFEFALTNPYPGHMLGCRPAAEFWRKLERTNGAKAMGEELRSFFFSGLPGFSPPVDPHSLGIDSSGLSTYYGTSGQLRVSQHMDDHWEMRQLALSWRSGADKEHSLFFAPTPVGNNPMPSRFQAVPGDPSSQKFADDFAWRSVESLAARRIERITMSVLPEDLSGESALGGDALNDYAARGAGNSYLQLAIAARFQDLDVDTDCPADDPLTPDSILRRATMDSCAGCHAPSQFLGPERKIGCGMTWPDSLGAVHVDEKGQRSRALQEVFLPHRADVLTTYLKACDKAAIEQAFGASPAGGAKILTPPVTIGGSVTH